MFTKNLPYATESTPYTHKGLKRSYINLIGGPAKSTSRQALSLVLIASGYQTSAPKPNFASTYDFY
jgi:hypothetical protein